MSIPKTAERRSQPRPAESREGKFVGRAVVYNDWSDVLFDTFRERIAPGTFDECLSRGGDLVATVNHDLAAILGRTSAGTLALASGSEGVDVEVTAGDYSYARDLATAIQRGDLRGMSFIFDVLADTWARGQDGVPERTVTKADIYEVSFVFHPAYPATEAGMRGTPLALPIEGAARAIGRAKAVLASTPALDLARRRLAVRSAEM